METRGGGEKESQARGPLKPSLVEWKPLEAFRERLRQSPLKPSLVEWKPDMRGENPR